MVTARRRTERLQDVPVAVTAMGGAQLERYNVTNVEGISQMVPTMVVGRQVGGSAASIYMRGVGSSPLSSGFEQSVSLNLDDIPMTRGREIINSQYDIEHVEVLKGPQALFFGKNSTGGVIVITSRDPTRDFEAKGLVGYEINARESYGEAVVSGPIVGDLLGRLAIRASRMDGWIKNTAKANTLMSGLVRDPQSDRFPGGDTLSGRLTLKYAPDAPYDITLKASATHITALGAGPYERLCGGGRTTPLPVLGVLDPYSDCKVDGRISIANIPPQLAAGMIWARDGDLYLDHISQYGVITGNYRFDNWTLTSVTSLYRFKQTDLNSYGGAGQSNIATQYARTSQLGQEFRAVSDFEGPLNVTAGAIFLDTDFLFHTSTFVTTPMVDPATGRTDSFYREDGYKGKSWSAFMELNWKVLPTLELAGGARWTDEKRDSFVDQLYSQPVLRTTFPLKRFEDHFKDSNLSPQATLTWRPRSDLMFYGAYKKGFKSGGYNTSLLIGASTQKPFGEFGSEEASGFEAGARTQWFNNRLTFNVTAYTYDYTDLQVNIYDSATLSTRVDNAGKLQTRGVDVQATWRDAFLERLDLHADLGYNQAKFVDYIATCYTGQTVAGGCNLDPNPATGAFNTQNLAGRTAPKAPKWTGRVGALYDADLPNNYSLTLTGDVSFSSKYNFTDSLRPDGVQKGFARFDASVRLNAPEQRWSLALIGRNLTNEWVITSANDISSSGAGGTGTNTGLVADLATIVDRGRQVALEFRTSF
jgi:outer membrane receptor protein involved in Fe transport